MVNGGLTLKKSAALASLAVVVVCELIVPKNYDRNIPIMR